MQGGGRYRRFVYALIKALAFVTLGVLLVMIRYVLKTPQPLKSVLTGEEHFYKWTHGHIYYQISGADDAPPLVLFHAPEVGASSYEMRNIVEGLSRQYRVYALDLPGFGLSDHPQGTYSALSYLALFQDFLRDVVRQPAILVASGLSGNYCIAVARQYPELCAALVLLTPATLAQRKPQHPWVTKFIGHTPLGFVLYTCLTIRWPLRWQLARQQMLRYQQITATELVYASAVAHQLGADHAAISYLAGELYLDHGEYSGPRDALIQLPTLLIYGSDSLQGEWTGQIQHSISTHQQEVIVRGACLRAHEEQPVEVVQAIFAWHEHEDQHVHVGETAPANPPNSPVSREATGAEARVSPAEGFSEISGPTSDGTSEAMSVHPEAAVGSAVVEAYCVKCRAKREMQGGRKIVTKNGRSAMEGTCPVCGTRLFRFVASGKE